MATSYAALRTARRAPSVWRHFDVFLAVLSIAVSAFGSLMIYSASRDQLQSEGINPHYYLTKQLIFLGVGVVLMVGVAAIDYRHYRDWAPAIYVITLLMLLAVLAIGHKSKGSQAWFQFGSYQLEPSEFAKIGLIIVLASFCAAFKGKLPGRALVVVLVLSAIPFALIYKQPDLGTALVLAAVLIAMLLVAGVRARHFAILVLVGVVGVIGVVDGGVLKSYQKARLTSFVSSPDQPDAKLLASQAGQNLYNLAESKITIGDGGLTGKGLFHGSQTNLSYVPEQHTDFIFTAVGEQLGFAGSALLLVLFLLMLWRIWRAASLSRDLFGTLLCAGVLAMLAFQMFENIGMTMGIMPIAGIPLPFMSYGGSALIATFAGIGLVINVRMRRFA
jgi:rod shape determining protein RodA